MTRVGVAVLAAIALLWTAVPARADVSRVTVDNANPSPAAGARTVYTVGFTTSADGGLSAAMGSKITVTLPDGTGFSGYSGSVVDGTTTIGGCGGADASTVTCTLNFGRSVPGDHALAVVLAGVTNPPAGQSLVAQVSTSADPSPVDSAPYTVVAAGPVTDVSVDNRSPTSAAGARTVYSVGFTTSSTGGLSADAKSEITVTLPAGTGFGGYSGSVVDGGTTIGGCGGATETTVTCTLNFARSVAANHAVTVQLAGVTNPAAGSGLAAQVSTTSDPASVRSTPYSVVTDNPVTDVLVDNRSPTNAAGARTVYDVGFSTSATGGLSADAKSTITVTLASGTGFTGYTGSVLDDTGPIGGCGSASGTTITCTLNFGRAVPAGGQITVQLAGVTNPSPSTRLVAHVSTSSDPAAVASSAYTVVASNPITRVTVDNGTPTRAAGGRTVYSVGFTTSDTGGLSADAKSTITVTLPAGTGFTGYTGSVLDGTTTIGGCGSATGTTVTCTLNFGRSVAADHAVTVQLAGVTNPSASDDLVAQVSTSSDTQPVGSDPYSVVDGRLVSDVTTDNSDPSAAAGARTVYRVAFRTSDTGAMSADAKSTITVTLPAGTGFSGYTGSVLDGTTTIGGCGSATGTTVTCNLNFGRSVTAGQMVTVQLAGVTNATAASGLIAQVSTSSDTATVRSGPFSVKAAQAVASPSVALGSTAASALTRYTVGFSTSSSGGLSSEAKSRITLTFPAGTGFAAATGSVLDGTTTIGGCDRPTGTTVTCTLNFGRSVPAGHAVTVRLDNVANPASASAGNTVRVATTSDLGAGTAPYTIGTDTSPPQTSISAGPDGQIAASGATFTFGSSEPGSTFTCRLDGPAGRGTPEPCTSPKTYTGLAPGTYTFTVAATDPAGTPDPNPPARSFRVAAPTPQPTVSATPTRAPTLSPAPTAAPTPSPTATPTPTPVPGRSVVAAPVKGTVKVRLRGTNRFVEVDATQGVPLGSTVDTRHGTIRLTAVQRIGGKLQTALFHAGLFKVTQTRRTTDLTLNQRLAPCRKQARKATVAAKKRKRARSRRLWGEGHGSFRTRGRYSAATVRGTKWLVQDSCTGTLTRVVRGVVSVRDNVRRKTITLRAGKRYLARPRR